MVIQGGNEFTPLNLVDKEQLLSLIDSWKAEGKKVGLTTGGFDLLHPGHVFHLQESKKHCDILIVAISRDSHHAQRRSESGRPIFSEQMRAYMVSLLTPVDYVIYDDWIAEINLTFQPDVYIKGVDYADQQDPSMLEQIRIVEKYGGQVKYTINKKLSTTEIIEHIKGGIGTSSTT